MMSSNLSQSTLSTLSTQRESLLARALSATASAALIACRQGRLQWVNQAFLRLSGYAEHEALGKSRQQLGWDASAAAILDIVAAGEAWTGETILRDKQGATRIVSEVITPLRDDAGDITCFIAIQQDITERRRSDASLRHRATHDALTGLANKACLLRELEQMLVAARQERHLAAAMFIDLDRFKPVNDRHGHQMGDLLLAAAAQRLKGAVRQGDLVARYGGDEFVILLRSIPDPAAALDLAVQVARCVGRPYLLSGQRLEISASVGVAVFPGDGDDAAALLACADHAMYRAKRRGGNSAEMGTVPCVS